MDFDPRDFDDPREDARKERNRSRRDDGAAPAAPRSIGSHEHDRDEDKGRDEGRSNDRDDDDTRSLARGGATASAKVLTSRLGTPETMPDSLSVPVRRRSVRVTRTTPSRVT